MPAQNNYSRVCVLFLVFSLQLTSPPSAMGANGILPRRGDLGVMVSAGPEAGVRVMQVRAGSTAARAGITVGDVILKIDAVELRGEQGEIAVDRVPTGEVTLILRRGNGEEVKRISVPELPKETFGSAE